MKNHVPDMVERGRVTDGPMGSDASYGFNGAFFVPHHTTNQELTIVASAGMDWEHVSVSCRNRCPNWQEMCFVKNLFWDEEEVVMQLHPAKSNYVNMHPNCLHLWKPQKKEIPLPPSIMVGFK